MNRVPGENGAEPSADIAAPGWLKLVLEARAPFEFAAGIVAAPLLLSSPRGDGHPVLVIPGFMASDFSTRPLRRLLKLLRYDVHAWGQGRNLGPRPGVLERGIDLVHALREKQDRKVSLVGWSLGGLFARELAKRVPDAVRSVVTLGSPFTGPRRATNAARLYERVNRGQPPGPMRHDDLRLPPPVPTTSIYSRTDGIVAWQCSVEQIGPMAENIEVEASHLGLGVNPLVMHALADRLAQPEGAWQPFQRTGLRRLLFPLPR